MKKKFISCLCVIALAMTMFPTLALAESRGSWETLEYWQCPKCYCDNERYLEEDYVSCNSCGKSFELCPDCSTMCWTRGTDYWYNSLCWSCGYEFYRHDVRANMHNQTYAYGQSNQVVVDVTYGVNWIKIYRINPNGSHVRIKSMNPENAKLYSDYDNWNSNYDYTIEYWDYNRQRDTKYSYYVEYFLKTSTGIDAKGGVTATKTYWTTPKAKASKVKKNGSKVTWSKVSGADGYRVTFKRYKNIGYHQWWLTNRNQWTTKNSAYRKLDPGPYYKYERVGGVRTYAKHGDKYYAHGKKVRTVKKNLFL